MKLKFFIVLVLSSNIKCFAQDFNTQITTFRKNYTEDFLTDKSSPLKKEDLQYLRFYDADSTCKVAAKETLVNNAQPFIMPVFSGTGREYVQYSKLDFTLKGKTMQLTVYRNIALSKLPQFNDYLFLPFTDETNGKESYGGGRYIDIRVGDFKNGTIIIDFNKAYNPYCAFSDGYACPKPPAENMLPIAVEAGEKMFAKAH